MYGQRRPGDACGIRRVDLTAPGSRLDLVARCAGVPPDAVDVHDGVSGDRARVAEHRPSGNRCGLSPRVGEGVVHLHVGHVVSIVPARDQEDERIGPNTGDGIVNGDGHRGPAPPSSGARIVHVYVGQGPFAAVLCHRVAAEDKHASSHRLGGGGEPAGSRHRFDFLPRLSADGPLEGAIRHAVPGLCRIQS